MPGLNPDIACEQGGFSAGQCTQLRLAAEAMGGRFSPMQCRLMGHSARQRYSRGGFGYDPSYRALGYVGQGMTYLGPSAFSDLTWTLYYTESLQLGAAYDLALLLTNSCAPSLPQG